ncbi:hypothetical protein CMO86_08095 [Candidatus Woesearchaeota archaeon]|jgi:hypothetical protein|nr:hypothetical protein [Candidatus Woesearchaeota archaeon]|tara:strand:+ start:428 stop:658 length:231 start_codon:yes stop_codon:yes gene_type:complete
MITVEMDMDETAITILDNTGELEDVQALLYDDYCHIRQWNEKTNMFEVITMTPTMYFKLMQAWRLPQGSYVLDKKT